MPGVGVTKPFSSVPLFSEIFNIIKTHYVLNIKFIFGRCRRSQAAVTPGKYECDSKNLRDTFVRSKILLTEKLTNGALVIPTLNGYCSCESPYMQCIVSIPSPICPDNPSHWECYNRLIRVLLIKKPSTDSLPKSPTHLLNCSSSFHGTTAIYMRYVMACLYTYIR